MAVKLGLVKHPVAEGRALNGELRVPGPSFLPSATYSVRDFVHVLTDLSRFHTDT